VSFVTSLLCSCGTFWCLFLRYLFDPLIVPFITSLLHIPNVLLNFVYFFFKSTPPHNIFLCRCGRRFFCNFFFNYQPNFRFFLDLFSLVFFFPFFLSFKKPSPFFSLFSMCMLCNCFFCMFGRRKKKQFLSSFFDMVNFLFFYSFFCAFNFFFFCNFYFSLYIC